MTPYEAIKRMNAGYTYALVNIKKKKVISVYKEYNKAFNKVKNTAFYRIAENRRKECHNIGIFQCLIDDDLITHDVVSLFDIAFNNGMTKLC